MGTVTEPDAVRHLLGALELDQSGALKIFGAYSGSPMAIITQFSLFWAM